jgi:hypothetical protein
MMVPSMTATDDTAPRLIIDAVGTRLLGAATKQV